MTDNREPGASVFDQATSAGQGPGPHQPAPEPVPTKEWIAQEIREGRGCEAIEYWHAWKAMQ